MKRILMVFGTRPEAVKMCPLIKEIEKHPEFHLTVCVTAQHRQMLDQVLEVFDVTPDVDLKIMQQNQSLEDITVRALSGVGKVIEEHMPDIALVHGDPSTAFASALAAFYHKTPVGHVEAGLRSGNMFSPFPEEMNRVLVDKMSSVLFAPTKANAENLRREGIEKNVYITGNTGIDALKYTVADDYEFNLPELNTVDFGKKIVTMTAHRRENYGEPMENIMEAAAEFAARHPEMLLIFPAHMSPYVQECAQKYLAAVPNIMVINPVDVCDMHNLMARSTFVMTDSGGLQEEAPSLGKPVMVLRRETERPEAAEAGTLKVVGTKKQDILSFAEELISGGETYNRMAKAVNPYGDGNASAYIVKHLKEYYNV